MGNTTNWLAIIVAILLIILVVWAVVLQVKEHHLQDDPMLREIRVALEPLFNSGRHWTGNLSSLNDRDILNEVKLYRGSKSYTINKEKIFLCLKDENKEYYDKAVLVYVAIHELSHCVCDEISHTQKFHDIFEELLLVAAEEGIYDPSIPIDPNYCKYGDEE